MAVALGAGLGDLSPQWPTRDEPGGACDGVVSGHRCAGGGSVAAAAGDVWSAAGRRARCVSLDASSVFPMNLTCVNRVGVTAFLEEGTRPATPWEKDRAAKRRDSLMGCIELSAALISTILL
jgi:hypothetical protein